MILVVLYSYSTLFYCNQLRILPTAPVEADIAPPNADQPTVA